MRKRHILASAAVVALLHGTPARAEIPVTNPISDALTNLVNQAQQMLWKQLSDLNITTLINGFNQLTNYMKAQVSSAMQIADASNTANATFQRQVRNADIVANHTVSPQACLALDSGQSITVAGAQADRVTVVLADYSDNRGEGGPGTPAYAGTAQAAQANRELHLTRYCSRVDAEAGLCSSPSRRANADQRASSLFAQPTYQSQPDIDAANDFATALLQPTPPAPLRGDERRGLEGVQAEQARKNYNARQSASHWAVDAAAVSSHASAVSLTVDQQAQQKIMGRPQTATGSVSEAIELEVNRRYGNQAWNVGLEAMPSAPVILREIARQLALQAYLTWQSNKLHVQEVTLLAAMNAADAERDLHAHQAPTMPTPLIGQR